MLLAVDGEYLPEVWVRETANFYAYTSECGRFLLTRENDTWIIVSPTSIVAEASSLGLHPATTKKGEWRMFDLATQAMRMSPLHFKHECLDSSPVAPLSLDDIGHDFFMRCTPRRILWYTDPRTGRVFHSGAKRVHGEAVGKRYCYECNLSFSANNFVSQHMRLKHPERCRPGSCVLECIFIDEV